MTAHEFGPWLFAARGRAGLSVTDVATALGVSRQTVYAWEKGTSVPEPERYADIELAYRVAAGSVRAYRADPLIGGSLDYWRGRAEQIALHLQDVLKEQWGLVEAMKLAGTEPFPLGKIPPFHETTPAKPEDASREDRRRA